jgi:hypothetical protein
MQIVRSSHLQETSRNHPSGQYPLNQLGHLNQNLSSTLKARMVMEMQMLQKQAFQKSLQEGQSAQTLLLVKEQEEFLFWEGA